jgi:2-methylisocitrate lyase-like PEP mutase family enzyme
MLRSVQHEATPGHGNNQSAAYAVGVIVRRFVIHPHYRRHNKEISTMPTRQEKVQAFRALHKEGCFVMPNPWDIAGTRMMTQLGFKALATTSSGYAFSQGKQDSVAEVGRDECLAYAAMIAAATDLPVTADTEDCYAATPDDIAETVRLAADAGVAGLSIEDRNVSGTPPIRAFDDAANRVAAAVEAAREYDIVLTARADGFAKGAYDIDEAIRRLQRYQELGAEVVYMPGVPDLATMKRLCDSVAAPFNHVAGQGVSGLSLQQIADAGVRRISVGGSLARAVGGAMLKKCRELAAGDFSCLETGLNWNDVRNPPPAL